MDMDFLRDNELRLLLALLFAATVFSGCFECVMRSPLLRTFRRWTRALFFSLAIAIALDAILENRSFAALCAVGALIYFGAETFLYWIKLSAANIMCPLFNRYAATETAWSTDSADVKLKLAIEDLGFRKSGAMKSNVFEDVDVLATSFDSPDSRVRLYVSFVPVDDSYSRGAAAFSRTDKGKIFSTEYSASPSGLPVPDDCEELRRPLAGGALSILKIHERRIKAAEAKGEKFIPFEEESVSFANSRVSELERAAAKAELLTPSQDVEFNGILTQEGKFRVWKDLIILNYLPFIIR